MVALLVSDDHDETSVVIRADKDDLLTAVSKLKCVKFVIQIGSDWPQMGQICDFLTSV